MTIQEFINYSKGKDFNIELIEGAKKYIPIEEKRKMAVNVISMCTDEIDGFIEVNRFRMGIYLEMYLLREYFNVSISDNFEDLVTEYDVVCESGILHQIHSCLLYEYSALKEILNQELIDLLEENSVQKQIVKVIGKINDLLEVFGDKIKDSDLKSLVPEGMDFSKLLNLLSMFK